MSDKKNAQLDSETILITLDQIGQTIDIMTNVVGRLRGYITEQLNTDEQSATDISDVMYFPEGTSRTIH